MAESPDYTDADPETGPARRLTTGTPRWVKVSGIIALALVVAFVVLKLTGVGGSHGPGRHTPGGDTTPAGDTSRGHTGPPPGVTHTQP
jgi:hypothetical protein